MIFLGFFAFFLLLGLSDTSGALAMTWPCVGRGCRREVYRRGQACQGCRARSAGRLSAPGAGGELSHSSGEPPAA